jgi:AraC-like DNA-binding protein
MPMLIGDMKGEWLNLDGNLHLMQDTGTRSPAVAEHSEEYRFSFGSLQMSYITLPGIYIVYGDVVLDQPQFRVRRYGTPHMVELHFALNGAGHIENHITGVEHVFKENTHSLSFIPEIDGTAHYGNQHANRIFEVHFAAPYFSKLAQGTNTALERFSEKLNSGKAVSLHEPNLPITLAMHQCIQDIMNCNFKGGLKHLFLQSKCIELLSLQAEAYDQSAKQQGSSVLRSEHDRDCIMQAKEYLLLNMDRPPSLQELAAIVGTNVFKLKNGFKELFNNTVFGYLNEVKLVQARELLLAGEPIKHVSDQLGYSSVQHFGSAFRKKFGTTPGSLRS